MTENKYCVSISLVCHSFAPDGWREEREEETFLIIILYIALSIFLENSFQRAFMLEICVSEKLCNKNSSRLGGHTQIWIDLCVLILSQNNLKILTILSALTDFLKEELLYSWVSGYSQEIVMS